MSSLIRSLTSRVRNTLEDAEARERQAAWAADVKSRIPPPKKYTPEQQAMYGWGPQPEQPVVAMAPLGSVPAPLPLGTPEDDSQYGLGTGDGGGQPWPQQNQEVAQAAKKSPIGFTWSGGTRSGQHSKDQSANIQSQIAAGRANYEAMLNQRRMAYEAARRG